MPKLQIPSKLEPFLTKKKRFKIAFGGRGAAKSQSFADIFLQKSQTEGAKIACFREMQNSIEDSVHSLLSTEIGRLDLDGFQVDKSSIASIYGGEFRFRGLARNPDAIKSMHGFKYFWVEEGQSISKDSLDKLTPTLREEGSELWISMNPQNSEDPMSKRFIKPFWAALQRDGYYEDDLHLIVFINYMDNPWFPESLESERIWDYDNKSRAEYDHIWLGHFNDSVENATIKKEWFDASIDAHLKLGITPRGLRTVSHDPSDDGDPKGLVARHGCVVLEAEENTSADVNEGCDWATDYAIEFNADRFIWDCDGLGISLKRQVNKSLPSKELIQFKGSEGPERPNDIYQDLLKHKDSKPLKNIDTFKNKRAQCYWSLRDRFYNTYLAVTRGKYIDPDELISISSKVKHLDKLRSEICRIPKKPNGSGLIQMMTKQEMKTKYKIESPNLADALMMSEAQEDKQKKTLKPLKVNTKYVV